jgi:hypothetical protein
MELSRVWGHMHINSKMINFAMLCFLSVALFSCGLKAEVNFQRTAEGTITNVSQCLVQDNSAPGQVSAHALASSSRDQASCEDSNNYVCESTTFGSGAVANGTEQQCADIAGVGQVCMAVDTAVISSASNSSRTIYHCSNTKLTNGNGYLIQAHAPTLETALAAVINQCHDYI